MKFKALIGTSILAMTVATPAYAQDAADVVERDAFGGEIVVTAQRQSERLQDVPIAVSAFSTEALEAQQIKTPTDLQQIGRAHVSTTVNTATLVCRLLFEQKNTKTVK